MMIMICGSVVFYERVCVVSIHRMSSPPPSPSYLSPPLSPSPVSIYTLLIPSLPPPSPSPTISTCLSISTIPLSPSRID